MRFAYLALLVITIFAVGCAKTSFVCPDGSTVASPEECAAPETPDDAMVAIEDETTTKEPLEPSEPAMEAIEPETPPAEPIESDDASMELIASGAAYKSGITYFYFGPDEEKHGDLYHLKGNKVAIETFDVRQVGDKYVTHVYLDITKPEGEGYCENKGYGECTDLNEMVVVSTDDFYRKSPVDWAKEVSAAADTEQQETINNRAVKVLEFETTLDVKGQMWVEAYYGIPMVVKLSNGDVHEYRDFSFGSVSDEMLEHQYIRD